MVIGSDGNVWAAEYSPGAIARITTAGIVTTFPVASSSPGYLVLGQDGNVWFSGYQTNKLGKITPSGTISGVSAYHANADIFSMTVGANGILWYFDHANLEIDGYDPGTGLSYHIAAPNDTTSLTTGPDGAIWFAEFGSGNLARLDVSDLSNLSIQEFALPNNSCWPRGLAWGSDGALWFAEKQAPYIGRAVINEETDGAVVTSVSIKVQEYPIPLEPHGIREHSPNLLAAAPDGSMYFVELSGNIGEVTPSGAIKLYAGLPNADMEGLVIGADGYLWIADYGNSEIEVFRPTWKLAQTALASDGTSRVLVTSPTGLSDIYFLDANGNRTGYTKPFYLAGYLAKSLTVGPGGAMDLLWTNGNGASMYWKLNSSGTLLKQVPYPPT